MRGFRPSPPCCPGFLSSYQVYSGPPLCTHCRRPSSRVSRVSLGAERRHMFRQAPVQSLLPGIVASLSKVYSVMPRSFTGRPWLVLGWARAMGEAGARARPALSHAWRRRMGCDITSSAARKPSAWADGDALPRAVSTSTPAFACIDARSLNPMETADEQRRLMAASRPRRIGLDFSPHHPQPACTAACTTICTRSRPCHSSSASR